jgi:hypothetical protein
MTKPTPYLDHDVHLYFVAALKRHGYDAHSTQEHGNEKCSDEEQLIFATNRNWSLLTYNIGDFSVLHQNRIARRKEHAGILLATQFNPAQTLRRLLNLLFLFAPSDLHHQCLFIGSWLDT